MRVCGAAMPLVQPNVAGASVVVAVEFLKVATTTKVFADAETVKGVPSRRAVVLVPKVVAFVSVSTRAIAARADAAGKSTASPPSSSTTMRAKM